MPRISFVKNKPTLQAESGNNLMETLLAHGIPVASSCKGDGICGKCRMRVQPTNGTLVPPTAAEQETLTRNQAEVGERLSCQLSLQCDMILDTKYW
jgi:ferredoxin, 2Fe-2S